MSSRSIWLKKQQMIRLIVSLLIAFCWHQHFGSDGGDLAFAQAPQTGGSDAVEFAAGQVLVKFQPDLSDHEIEQTSALLRARTIERFALDPHLHLLELGAGVTVQAAVNLLSNHPNVVFAEPNFIYRTAVLPNDPGFTYFGGQLWGLHNEGRCCLVGGVGGKIDADIDGPEAWDIATGSKNVVVGVVDTGIDYNHKDLQANMWINPGEIAGNLIDDDGNGYVDDIHGINAITGTGDPLDDNDHGTHVSGTIGAVGNNGKGVAGVNWNVGLMALKFLNSFGFGRTSNAIKSIDYAVMMKLRGAANVIALNASWGGGAFSQALLDAINRANSAGILFVAAAGNSGSNNDAQPHYPSSYNAPNVIAVAATDKFDNLASFSNFGATSVDLGGPGVDIASTVRNNSYAFLSGTSMATPHVTGTAALVKAARSALTHLQIRDLIFATVVKIPALVGKTVTEGRVNAFRAVAKTNTIDP